MARDKKDNRDRVDVSEEVVNAFEAVIVFGRMVESRRPKHHPLWSDDEWLQGLIKAVGKKSKVSRVECGSSGEEQRGTMKTTALRSLRAGVMAQPQGLESCGAIADPGYCCNLGRSPWGRPQ
jgi:hypothetical protein